MNAEMIIEKIRDSIENYEAFKELALDIRFRKADRRFYSWEQGVEGMVVHLFRFVDGINEDNFVETITQCRLMRMADNEEWEDDFWDSMEDRLIVLNSPMCIRDDLIIKEVHLKPLDTKECLDTVRYLMKTYSPVKDFFILPPILRIQYVISSENRSILNSVRMIWFLCGCLFLRIRY